MRSFNHPVQRIQVATDRAVVTVRVRCLPIARFTLRALKLSHLWQAATCPGEARCLPIIRMPSYAGYKMALPTTEIPESVLRSAIINPTGYGIYLRLSKTAIQRHRSTGRLGFDECRIVLDVFERTKIRKLGAVVAAIDGTGILYNG